jgi:hypothetical protein
LVWAAYGGKLEAVSVGPETIWFGQRAAKEYLKEDFAEVFPRYIPI